MTDTKFTPAPWSWIKSNNSNLIHIETPCEHPQAGFSIATMKQGNKEQRIANANLIYRSPNMYMLLDMMLKAHKTNIENGNDVFRLPIELEYAIEEELKKARGE